MKKLLSLILGLVVTGYVFGIDVAGTITTNTTWNLAGSPYVVTGDVTVNPGITLTVDPNVVVKFNSARTLYVQGTLNATSATFTSNLATPAPGNWNGIYVTNVAGIANLSGCTVRYAVQLYNQNGTMNLTNTVLEFFSTYGLYNGATITMTGGLIDMTGYTSVGYGIYPLTGSTTTLNNVSIIKGNYGIVLESPGSAVNLTDVTITNNIWPIYYGVNSSLSVNGSCSFTGNTRNAVNVYLSSITTALTFPKINVPYYFNSDFTVQSAATLTIGSGNILKFPLYNGLIVNGTLIADAATGENIFFTSHRDDNWGGDSNNDGTSTAPAVSNWYGVRFSSTSSGSLMDRCKLRYAGYGNTGGISMFNASPTITNCELQFNYYGAYLSGACSPNFSFNTIGSSTLTPIAMSIEAFPEFTDNVLSFMDNQYDAIGILDGTLTADANLIQRNFTTVSNITYVLFGSLTIPAGRTLTIQPGIVIKPLGAYQIIVQGKLVADGTPAQKIVLTSIHDDNFGNPGDTNRNGTLTAPANNNVGAVIFANGYDPTSIMDNWIMKYAFASGSYPNGTGSHSIYSSAVACISALPPSPAGPTISNCEFSNLSYGIVSYQAANPVITNNSMVNIAGTAFAVSAAANPTFSGNTFSNVGIIAMGLVGNTIYANGTISKRNLSGYNNITYFLLEPLTIANNTYITVDPGVVIKLADYQSIVVNGGFKTNGTVTEPVIFTSYKDDNVGNPQDTNGDGNATAPAAGNWYFIRYTDNSDDAFNVLNYAVLKYGGYGTNASIFTTTNASPTLNNSVIDQASGGIRCEGNSAGFFNNVTIQNTWAPIGMSLTSNPTFTNITYTANSNNGIWIIDNTLASNVTLTKRNVAGFTNIPYIIGSLTINSGATLTLVPGIILKLQGGAFTVNGGLNATGTSGEKIYFTSFKDDAVGGDTNNDGSGSVPGYDWSGFAFQPSSIDENNKLIYCDIRYLVGYGSLNCAVNATDAAFEISNTALRFVSGTAFGIYGTANPVINNCQLENISQYPVYMDMFASPTFSGTNTLSNVAYHAIYLRGQTISQSATMPQRNFAGYNNITYVMGAMTINSGTTFTIPAGTVIKGGSFTVNGKLLVAGTSGNPVVFTDLNDDSYGNPADTQQNGNATYPSSGGTSFTFNDVSDDASSINYAIMRYTNYGITLNSAAPSITNTTFNRMVHGIWCLGVSTPVINNNTFHDLTNAPFVISLVSYPASTVGNIISGTTYKAIIVNSETLTQDVTLPKRSFAGINNIPYLFQNYTIGTGVTLTIQPGVIIKFGSSGSMTVNNGLIAEGTATNEGNIVFTSISDDFHGGDSNSDGTATPYNGVIWYGITVNDVANDALTRFQNCIFRMAWTSQGTIRTNNANPSILNCNFNNCYNGVYATGTSNPIINYCDFYDINQQAVNNVNQTFTINAENCWWGSNTGPTHSGNPGGTGEPVTNGVDYMPYGTNGVVNPLTGDVSLNGSVQAYDASLVLKHVATVITLNAKQQVVADVSGTAGITAYDASLILQFAVGMISTFPAELLSPVSPATSNAELVIGDATAMPVEEFLLPLSLSNVDEVFAGQMSMSYDKEVLDALEIISLVPEMTVVSNIDPETGTIHLTFAGVEALQSDLTFAEIRFKAKGYLQGQETVVEGKSFMANESELNGNITSGMVTINSIATGVNGLAAESGKSLNCYPNPVRDQLTIEYEVRNDGDNVQIAVYDLYGKMVAEVVNGRHAAESYSVVWNTQDSGGEQLPFGTYIIRLTTGSKTEVQKIQIVR